MYGGDNQIPGIITNTNNTKLVIGYWYPVTYLLIQQVLLQQLLSGFQ